MSEQEKTRNSPLRKTATVILNPLVNEITKIPGITANKVTATGTMLVIAGALERIIDRENLSLPALALIAFGVSCDALDGAVARKLGQSSEKGAVFDLLNDRFQESVLCLSRIATASFRRDPLGLVGAVMSGLTSPLPSLVRAKVEEKGGVVSELGKNPMSFLGNRLGRMVLGVPATVAPELFYTGPLAFQTLADLLTTIANITSASERRKELLALSGSLRLAEENDLTSLGKRKKEVMKRFTVINSLVILSSGVIGLLSFTKQK